MADTTTIYGPKPGQPPIFTIDNVHICAADIGGGHAILITGATDPEHAHTVSLTAAAVLSPWLPLPDLGPMTTQHFGTFHRCGRMTREENNNDRAFTFTVDDTGPVMLYPIPDKTVTELNGTLLSPQTPALFPPTTVTVDDSFEPAAEPLQLAHLLASVMALHRLDATVCPEHASRVYRPTPGGDTITARITLPTATRQAPRARTEWATAVTAALSTIPHLTCSLLSDTDVPEPIQNTEILVECDRPRQPWSTG